MDDRELVVVFDAESDVQALLYRTMLEEAGIDVVERQLEVPWFEGVRWRALHSQLLVRAEDAERASTLVREFTEAAEQGNLNVENPEGLP